ncbi:NAD(P)H-dependent oxidoreductase [bacterium]|nr:NAD(P)H-dependent oxidoreductase [bacterium]
MTDQIKLIAVVGSYRKGGIIDTTIDEILSSAREEGAATDKIYLIDKHIEFCTNCRMCTQQKGFERGKCIIEDDMNGILDELQDADVIILGSPMNFGTVTAIMKKFIERLVCFAYWPWGKIAPKKRAHKKTKYAVIVVSSAAPSLLARLMSKMVKLLKDAAGLLGAHTIGVLSIGLAAGKEQQDIGKRTRVKARRLGKKLMNRKQNSDTNGTILTL